MKSTERAADETPFEAAFELTASEFEASVLTGALEEFAERWPEAAPTAKRLAEQIRAQLPRGWVEG